MEEKQQKAKSKKQKAKGRRQKTKIAIYRSSFKSIRKNVSKGPSVNLFSTSGSD
jgi:hypothetical protein